ncbi:MAG: PAS domain-containing protein [Oscillibacter sp.]|jgi:PAS domain S-box-containing protein|nr:PAS domain-containing protein [Oscillibacter sp.]
MDEQKYYQIEELKSIFSAAPFGIAIFIAQTRQPLFLNNAYYHLVGYAPDEYAKLIANEDQKLLYPADLPISRKNTEQFSKTGNVPNARFRIVRKSGEVRWVALRMIPVTVDDAACALCFFDDITMEREQSAQLKLVSESIGSSICVMRVKEGKEQILYANDTFFKLIGIDRERYLENPSVFDGTFTTEEDRIRTRNAIKESLHTGKPQELTYRFLRPGSDPVWMQRRLSVLRGDGENTYLMASIATDISEKKKAEMALALKQSRYQLVVDEMKAAVFEWDLQSGTFYCSDSYREYAMSAVPSNVILANKGPADVIHPDDQQAVRQFFADTMSGAHRAEAVLRMRLTAGGYRWCKLVGIFYRDKDGNPTRTLGMIININEEREKSFMLDSLLNELPGGVAVFKVGKVLKCQYFNDGFARLSNRTRKELNAVLQSGQLLEASIAPSDWDRFHETLRTSLALGGQINITFRFFNKAGELSWLHMNASKLREEDGCPVYYCIFTRPSDEATLYRSVVEDSATGVFIGERKTRRIVYRNKTMRGFFHVEAGTPVLGQPLFDVIPQSSALLSDNEIASLPTDHYAEYHWQHEGRYYNVRAKALIWNGIDAYILYLSDETQEHQKRIEQETLLNQVPVGIGIYEIAHGNIRQLYMNDSYYRMIGEPRETREKKRDNFLLLVHPDDLAQVHTLADRCAAGSEQEVIDHRVLCGDGSYRWFRLTASVVKRESDKITVYCSYGDIDDAIKTHQELESANSELQKQYHQELSQRKMLEKDSMIAVQFNVTQDRLVSYRVNQGMITHFSDGTAGIDIRPGIAENIPTEAERRVAKDFFDRDKALERYRNGTKEFSAVYRRRLNNGRLCWLHSTCRLAQDEENGDIISYTYMRNIDIERKKELTAESVIDEETDFVMLLNTVSDTAMLLRLQNDYQGFSGKLYQEFPFENALDMGELDMIETEDRPIVRAFFREEPLIEKLKKNPVVTVTYRHCHADGTVRWKKTRAFYLDDTHEDIVIARRDITDLYEEERQQQLVLKKALDEANAANIAKSEFLSRMSHDLRTPMNVIIGLTSLAMDMAGQTGEMKETLSNIAYSSNYLLSLINDCLDIEKITSGKIELHPAPYPYSEFRSSIQSVIAPLCREKNITLVMDEPSDVTAVIVADRIRLYQIFYNLLSNAVKFTPNGGKVEMLTRTVSCENGYVTNECIVRDNGIGMSEEFQKHMFEEFSQESTSVTAESQGTGLGLAIVKQLTELMGAEMTVKSKPHEGTEFKIRFHFPEGQEAADTVKEKAPVPMERLRGKRVLLAEDHPLNAVIAQKLLEKAGITVAVTNNGQDAVDCFKSTREGSFDAVLMDIRMPVMNGLDATRAIRGLDRSDAKTVPIIAMTANAFDTDVEGSLHAGMNAHLSKPIEPEKLYETLAKLIR